MNATFIFVAASFCSSFALFLVEPLIGKRLLPILGGSPSVWVVATVVFQVLLLLGYVYAHVLAKLKARSAALIHLACMGCALATYPFSLGTSPMPEHPTLTSALLVARSVGLPFFALSANAPLLQSWFRGGNKYRLYAASNAGSFAALFVFPFLLEPFVGLRRINMAFAAIFFVSLMLLAWCAVVSRAARSRPEESPEDAPTEHSASEPVTARVKVEWVLLSSAASLLLSSVNAFVVVDLGALPLLWVVPLAIYLLSFVIGFEEKISIKLLERFLPFVSLAVVALLVHRSPQFVTWTIVVMLL
ncbi:MAG: hypothetical protein KBF88_14750, partial [Polyangiaceae bacterium]|nr:hypothetical protein [Polyangiaceae bacterium]